MSMTCDEREQLIGAYVDGELDLSASLDLESHIHNCAHCTAALNSVRALTQSMAAPELKYAPSKTLEASVLKNLRNRQVQENRSSKLRGAPKVTQWLLAGASLVCFLFAAIAVFDSRAPVISPHESQLADQVIASHIRSLQANHLTDVASTDQHTVKPWFDGKLDFGVPVADLAQQGYPLIGGRLDYMDNKPVAALVYRRFKHVINVFVWPSSGDEPPNAPVRSLTRRGYNIEYWRSGGMTYWAISDVNANDLAALCSLIQQNAPIGSEH